MTAKYATNDPQESPPAPHGDANPGLALLERITYREND